MFGFLPSHIPGIAKFRFDREKVKIINARIISFAFMNSRITKNKSDPINIQSIDLVENGLCVS